MRQAKQESMEYRHQIQSYTCEIDSLKGTVSIDYSTSQFNPVFLLYFLFMVHTTDTQPLSPSFYRLSFRFRPLCSTSNFLSVFPCRTSLCCAR